MVFLQYLALDFTANCICEIHCIALDGFDLSTAHKLSSKEKKILTELGFESGAAGWDARMQPLCYAHVTLCYQPNFLRTLRWCEPAPNLGQSKTS